MFILKLLKAETCSLVLLLPLSDLCLSVSRITQQLLKGLLQNSLEGCGLGQGSTTKCWCGCRSQLISLSLSLWDRVKHFYRFPRDYVMDLDEISQAGLGDWYLWVCVQFGGIIRGLLGLGEGISSQCHSSFILCSIVNNTVNTHQIHAGKTRTKTFWVIDWFFSHCRKSRKM